MKILPKGLSKPHFSKPWKHNGKHRVFKIGIRLQLLTLVICVALGSLLTLAITTGVYFTTNYRSTREDRLETVAQLKASQMEQTLNFLYYQVYWLTIRESIQSSLASYRAGNTSDSNWAQANYTIEQFLQSSLTFASVRMYDARFNMVVASEANWSNSFVPDDVQDQLFPLDQENFTVRDTLDTVGMLTGPISNDSSTMVLSMTVPIFYAASILFDTSDLVGYVTTIMSASSFKSALDDNTTLVDSDVVVLTADPNNGTLTVNSTFRAAFPVEGYVPTNVSRRIGSSFIANQALRLQKTGTTRIKSYAGENVVAGYCPVSFDLADWAAIVQQKRSTFDQPSTKLVKILIGVCFGIAVFMALVTLPLTHWAVKPILRLQQAAESIAAGRGLHIPSKSNKRDPDGMGSLNSSSVASGLGPGPAPPYTPSPSPMARDSVHTDHGLSEAGSISSSGDPGISASYLHNARIPYYSRFFEDELTQLTETFNAMTDELDRQYTHLEDRVKARTKQLEAAKIQAEAANDAKTVFIANISHELRTPLNGILGMTAIAMAETDTSKVHQSLKLIFRSGELLLHILTELLTFSKNSLKRSKLENADFCIMEVALQIKSIFGKLAKDQNVKLAITLTPNEIRKMVLYGDSNRIIQVVMNLVSNSLKFTPVDGKVTVTIRNLGEYDEEKSREDDYKHVYIRPNSLPQATCLEKMEHPLSDHELSTSNETTTSDDDDDDELETRSVVTVSTSSFDDNFFKTQFKLSTPEDEEEQIKTVPLPDNRTWVFEFVVEDTGPGIAQDLQNAVFEPFVQGDQTLSRQYGGTGLGLSICRQLATMMHGVMELESTVGVGSKFIFRVPLVQHKELVIEDEDGMYEDEFNIHSKKNRRVKIVEPRKSGSLKESAHSEPEMYTPTSEKTSYFDKSYWNSTGTAKSSSSQSSKTEDKTSLKKLKILVAEDNGVNQEVIKRMLNLEGFTDLEMARDGEEAINLVKKNIENGGSPIDIIFMDVQMPKVDGLMATKTIRSALEFDGPIVALTAFADESNVKECLDCGMTGFLSKPIRRTQLRKVLEKFCGVSHKEMVATPTDDHVTTKNPSEKESGDDEKPDK